MDNQKELINDKVIKEIKAGILIFLFGVAVTAYYYIEYGIFNAFVFNGITFFASVSLYKIGYIFCKNKSKKKKTA
jgi:hypothetical protein